MTVASVVGTVQTYVGTITGIDPNHVRLGMPNENTPAGYDMNGYPLVVLTAPQRFVYTRAGMGVGGGGFDEYDVLIRIFLGSPEMPADTAISTALGLIDRFRARFAPDWTMGVCFNSDLRISDDNLDSYREAAHPPRVDLRLHIEELRDANASAA